MTKANCKYPEWLTDYTLKNCKLNRKEYGEFLINYIVGEKDGFVLNLNGEWGSGKTQFLRRLYSELIKSQHPCIYIDAWESDFSDIPLSVVASELTNQLSLLNDKIGGDLEKVGEFLGKALKGTIIGGAAILSKNLVGDSSVGVELTKALFEQDPKDFLKSVQSDHLEQIDAIKQVRINLENLAEVINKNYGFTLPIVVLVDELDRCRPYYAIEMLEVIKHFFTTKNFVFIIATDTSQLLNSIKAIYGSEFDSYTYLKRFFNREARLPEPDIEHYLDSKNINLSNYTDKVILYPDIRSNCTETIKSYLVWVALAHDLSIRDIDQMIGKLEGCLRTALSSFESSKKIQYINIFILICAIVEFDKDIPEFNLRKLNNPEPLIKVNNNIFIDKQSNNKNKFLLFYTVNLRTSVLYEIKLTSGLSNGQVKKVSCTNANLGIFNLENYNGDVFSALNLIQHTHQTHERQSQEASKLWLWHDYKKVVKLAGNIT